MMLKFSFITAITIACMCFYMTGFADMQQGKAGSGSIQKELATIENSVDGRIGVFAINTANNTHIQYRANERFPFCSTFKLIGVSAILKRSMKDANLLQQHITYKREDVINLSSITEKRIRAGMTISELCAAAIIYSDNTAINLLMKKLGGPSAVTAFAASIGDHSFRLDRSEPELNSAIPGDIRDTTTPVAMAHSLQRLVLGNILASSQRELLQNWLKSSVTGSYKIRAGVPHNWIVGDKTGSGNYGTTNDIAVIWPPKCAPIVMVIFLTQKTKNATPHDDVIASVTKLLVKQFALADQCIRS